MRFIKLVFISLLLLFLLITGIGLLFPSTVKVSRTVNVLAPTDSVFRMLNDVKYWKLWMQGADTNTVQFLSPQTAGKGTIAKVGTGEVKITYSSADSIISYWSSEKGNVQKSGFIIVPSQPNSTVVNWYFQQDLGWYPWERFGSFANDKILGPVMEQIKDKLKKILEKN